MSNLEFEMDENKRPRFTFHLPVYVAGTRIHATMSWKEWNDYAKELNQELAKRLRVYPGPSEEDDPPPGGTPVLMRMAA